MKSKKKTAPKISPARRERRKALPTVQAAGEDSNPRLRTLSAAKTSSKRSQPKTAARKKRSPRVSPPPHQTLPKPAPESEAALVAAKRAQTQHPARKAAAHRPRASKPAPASKAVPVAAKHAQTQHPARRTAGRHRRAVKPEPSSEAAAPPAKAHVRTRERVARRSPKPTKGVLPAISPELAAPPGRAARSGPLEVARVPSILLESDRPGAAVASGPGQRYVLGPVPPPGPPAAEGELPESYGTRQLLLAARDPHWLYAHWDLTREQQLRYNSLAADGHLVLRAYVDAPVFAPAAEVHVHPESRHWFIHVERAGTRYVGELGYYRREGRWTRIAVSAATLTPPDTVSADTSADFATIPFELPLAKLVSLVKEAVQENVPLARALEELRAEGHPELPPASVSPPAAWTPAQELALAEVLSLDAGRRVWMGSLEITELVRRHLAQELASIAAAPAAAPISPAGALGAITSPAGMAAALAPGFWFSVNTELVVYGATEPNATVTIAGRAVRLRPDGSFTCRFALPDGTYELPVVAVSADQTDGRGAELKFSRSTEYRGDVGAHPQDPALKPPDPENV